MRKKKKRGGGEWSSMPTSDRTGSDSLDLVRRKFTSVLNFRKKT